MTNTKVKIKPEKQLTLAEKVERVKQLEPIVNMERFCYVERNGEFVVYSTRTWQVVRKFLYEQNALNFVRKKNAMILSDKYRDIKDEYKQLTFEINYERKYGTPPVQERTPLLANYARKLGRR